MGKIDVVCGVVINDKNEVLITQRGDESHFGKWEFPGGKVENSEDCFESIIREIKEELCLKVKPIEILHKYIFENYLLTFIKCHLKSFDIELKEHRDYKWVNYDELKSFEFIEGDVEFVNNISNYGII